jgi:hypothetical protein
MKTFLKIIFQLSHSLLFLAYLGDCVLNKALSKVAILAGVLSDLVAFYWVAGCSDLGWGFASEKILD